MVIVTESRIAWKLLRGIFCVYKPPDCSIPRLIGAIKHNLSQDLCELKAEAPTSYVSIEGNIHEALTVTVTPSYITHPCVMGPRYQPEDMYFRFGLKHDNHTSGVLPIGLNDSSRTILNLHKTYPTRTYQLKGKFGEATDTYFTDGAVVQKVKYSHVKQGTLDRILAYMQASHQKKMFDLCGLDIQSQDAYELACQGVIRPTSDSVPVIYSMKCIDFKPPNFTIEIVCVNEYEMYMKELIHTIGIKINSVATCTGIRCIRYGHFTLEHALLRRHWRLEHVINNIITCNDIVNKYEATKQTEAKLVNLDETVKINHAS